MPKINLELCNYYNFLIDKWVPSEDDSDEHDATTLEHSESVPTSSKKVKKSKKKV